MSRKNMISTHILDTVNGGAACNVSVSLYKLLSSEKWDLIKVGKSDPDGRCASFITEDRYTGGIYKLVFEIGEYFKSKGQHTIFPTIDVTFECEAGQHYHMPILVSTYSYTTYRGK